MKKSETSNTFLNGLAMDFNPLVLPEGTMTNCLNGTLLTMDGNENVLQNDMGNIKVDNAQLPSGYVPVGTCELGGIIYITSYNPHTKKYQIGSFPSPERISTQDEREDDIQGTAIKYDDFFKENKWLCTSNVWSGEPFLPFIINTSKIVQLSKEVLHTGDKFLIYTNGFPNNTVFYTKSGKENEGYITFKPATIDNNNRIIYLDDLLVFQYKDDNYHPLQVCEFAIDDKTSDNQILSGISEEKFNEYRTLINSNYDIYTSKVAGNLYLIAELQTAGDYDINYEILTVTVNNENKIEAKFKISTDLNTSKARLVYTLDQNFENIIDYEPNLDDVMTCTSYIGFESGDGDVITLTGDDNDIASITFFPVLPYGIDCLKRKEFTIDLSLLGSNEIVNDRWRYVTSSNTIQIDWSITDYSIGTLDKIKSILMLFYKYTTVMSNNLTEDDHGNKADYTYNVSPKSSGSYTTVINFSNIDADSLYYVELVFTRNNGTDETVTIPHCLYTNGIFNTVYKTDDTESTLNFDTLNIDLDYQLNNEFSMDDTSYTYTTKEPDTYTSYTLIGDDNLLSGTTTTQFKGVFTVDSNVSIVNDYNTFEIDSSKIQYELISSKTVTTEDTTEDTIEEES